MTEKESHHHSPLTFSTRLPIFLRFLTKRHIHVFRVHIHIHIPSLPIPVLSHSSLLHIVLSCTIRSLPCPAHGFPLLHADARPPSLDLAILPLNRLALKLVPILVCLVLCAFHYHKTLEQTAGLLLSRPFLCSTTSPANGHQESSSTPHLRNTTIHLTRPSNTRLAITSGSPVAYRLTA